jgi:hypothetical protein
MALLAEDGKARKGSEGLVRTVRTDEDGTFTARGLVPGRYEARISGGAAYQSHVETIDAAGPPTPWHVVLAKTDATKGGGGILWLRVRTAGDRGVEGRARAALFRTTDLMMQVSIVEPLQGSEIHWYGAFPGTFHALFEVEGYAPVVIPSVVVTPAPQEPVLAIVSPGVHGRFELRGAAGPGTLEVLEQRFGLKVAELALRPPPDKTLMHPFRLEPGSYTARLVLTQGSTAESSFVLGDSAGEEPAVIRLEAPPVLEGKGQ